MNIKSILSSVFALALFAGFGVSQVSNMNGVTTAYAGDHHGDSSSGSSSSDSSSGSSSASAGDPCTCASGASGIYVADSSSSDSSSSDSSSSDSSSSDSSSSDSSSGSSSDSGLTCQCAAAPFGSVPGTPPATFQPF